MSIESLVVELSSDSENPELNFAVAVEYESLNQTASAISFYLRTVEFGNVSHPLLAYSSLLKMAKCFHSQKDRNLTVTGVLLQAITLLPDAPDAYFLLAQAYENLGSWQECYTFSRIGLAVADLRPEGYFKFPLPTTYEGKYCLEYQSAISAFWVGRVKESIKDLKALNTREDMTPMFKQSIEKNLEKLDAFI